MSQYIAQIEHRVAGIPCLIGVIEYTKVKPNSRADNDLDYHGYTKSSWEVLDSRGRKADWLAKKFNSKEEDKVEEAIANHFNEETV